MKENFVSYGKLGNVCTGRIEVGPGALGYANAGVSGAGTSGSDIRFWAGATFENRASAPFRVRQDGKVFATSGEIGGWTLASDAIYACDPEYKHTNDGFSTVGITLGANGSIHAPRFYLNQNGSLGIRSSVSGKRIEIDSVNNRLDFYNSDGINVVRIDDDCYAGLYPGIKITNPADSNQFGDFGHLGFRALKNGVGALLSYNGSVSFLCLKGLAEKPPSGTFKTLVINTDDGFCYWQ